MGAQTDKQAEKIINCCGRIAVAVVIVLAVAVFIGIIVLAVWLNT